MTTPAPTDAQRRLLAAVAQRLPPERVRELYLFAPMRQGGVEMGLAVIAVGEPEAAPDVATTPTADASAVPDAPSTAVGVASEGADGEPPPGEAACEAPPSLSSSAEVVRAVVLSAEAAAEQRAEAEAPCDPTEDAAGPPPADTMQPDVAGGVTDSTPGGARGAPPEFHDTAIPPADQHPSAAPDVALAPGAAAATPAEAVPPPLPARERFTVYTARYRLQLKGPDRGKWETEVVEEADAPLLTVDAVVRGVQRRAGEVAEVERLSVDDLRRLLAEGV